MFETLENDPSLTTGDSDSSSPFGNPMLVPILDAELPYQDHHQEKAGVTTPDPAREAARLDREALERERQNTERERKDAERDREAMEQTIAMLQATLEQKEHAVVQSSISAAGLQQQLEKSKAQNDQLRKKLTHVAKAHEALTQKTMATGQVESTGGRLITEVEVAHMKEQWRVAQKSMEREYGRLQGELAKAKMALHQAAGEVETQMRARRSDAAQASHRIASLEHQVETARSGSEAAAAAEKGSNLWLRLSAASAATAGIMVAMWFWWPSLNLSPGKVSAAAVQTATAAPIPSSARPAVASSALNVGSSASNVGSSALSVGSRGAFQKSLSRLNNVLYGPHGATPEQILRAVRESNAKTDPSVCNFQWNNGQPALYFGGAQTSLGDTLDRCATAVDQYLKPGAATLTSKK